MEKAVLSLFSLHLRQRPTKPDYGICDRQKRASPAKSRSSFARLLESRPPRGVGDVEIEDESSRVAETRRAHRQRFRALALACRTSAIRTVADVMPC
jgi:hypothetical protein